MNLELYINNRLCDIESPEKLGITLKRVFINPSELSIKDAQKSYDISLPATPVNNEIFNYSNVEETQGKFKIYGDARLYVNGVLILDGKFRLSEITKDYYRGNLGVPAPITVKDIFGETMMNQAGKWMIDYKGIESISEMNKRENPDCIFPFVLYGLLNKYDATGKYYNEIKDKDGKNISYKQIYDESVIHNIKDFPPSVNCIKMLENIFKKAGYTLTGSALEDERLKNLYVSYKNPENYEAVWGVDKTEISGTWVNAKRISSSPNSGGRIIIDEYNINMPEDSDDGYIITDLLAARMADLEKDDPGMNISEERAESVMSTVFKVPHSGLYKVFFHVNFEGGTQDISNRIGPQIKPGKLNNQFYEIKVLRYTDRSIVKKQQLDNIYYRDNINQQYGDQDCIYPKANNVNFIDPKVNRNLVCGISLGGEQLGDKYRKYINPLTAGKKYHNPIAISGGTSWTVKSEVGDNVEKETYRAFSTVKGSGYQTTENTPDNRFIVPLKNIPPELETQTVRNNDDIAEGQVSQVIWLDKGEMLTIVSVLPYNKNENIWQQHYVNFKLSLTPFKKNKNWININDSGAGNLNSPMLWDDNSDFEKDKMNLSEFLPSEIKINDWIDNFCKAFNLELINRNSKKFELNIKRNNIPSSSINLIDIDSKVNINQRKNESLKLPRLYELGFTVDTAEEGYFRSMAFDKDNEQITNSGIDGKGLFHTGSSETTTITQSSSFSYCWYKDLYDQEGKLLVTVPVISEHEIWDNDFDYQEMAGKLYSDKTQRFWYRKGILPVKIGERLMDVALVSNEHKGAIPLILDYEYKPYSIMRNFFLILTNNNNDYTTVNCSLSADEYAGLEKSLIKLNGDLYNIAEVDGYDPLCITPCALKLIRRIM